MNNNNKIKKPVNESTGFLRAMCSVSLAHQHDGFTTCPNGNGSGLARDRPSVIEGCAKGCCRATARRNQVGAIRHGRSNNHIADASLRVISGSSTSADVVCVKRKVCPMRISMVLKITCSAAALAIAGAGISTVTFARGGNGGGSHFHASGGLGGSGSFSAGGAPSVLPTPLTPNSPLSRDIQGLNFNRRTHNRATPMRPLPMRRQSGTPKPSFELQLDKMNRQPGSVTLP